MEIRQSYGMCGASNLGGLRQLAGLEGALEAPVYIYRDSYVYGSGDYPLGNVREGREGGLELAEGDASAPGPMTLGEFLSLPQVAGCPDDIELTHLDEVSWNAAEKCIFSQCAFGTTDTENAIVRIW